MNKIQHVHADEAVAADAEHGDGHRQRARAHTHTHIHIHTRLHRCTLATMSSHHISEVKPRMAVHFEEPEAPT